VGGITNRIVGKDLDFYGLIILRKKEEAVKSVYKSLDNLPP